MSSEQTGQQHSGQQHSGQQRSARWAGWMHDGEAALLAHLDDVDDAAAPSLLPGWTRGHVLAHLAGNARALGNLVTWASTGVETTMYASNAARAEQIEQDATLPRDRLLDQVRRSSAALVVAYDAMDAEARSLRVRTAQGRDRAAAEIAWMRSRESWLHLVDLDAGFVLDDLPPAIVDAVLDDAAAGVGARVTGGVVLAPDDRARVWAVGSAPKTTVAGSAADLLGYLIGRPPPGTSGADRPTLPAWL